MSKRALGFSLIELALIVAIIGIGFAIASPRYANAQNHYKVQLASKQLFDSLKIATTYAKSKKQAYKIDIKIDSGVITFVGIPNPTKQAQDWSLNLTNQYQVSLTQSPSGINPIINGYGKPDQDYSWEISLGTHSHKVEFSRQTGVVTMSP